MTGMKVRMPDFFVVGAAKSGTTALFHLLRSHPGIYLSPIKEPNYFCTDIRPAGFSPEYQLHESRKRFDLDAYLEGPMDRWIFDYFVTRPEQYAALFRHAGQDTVTGEMSNSYLFSAEAARNISTSVPHARIVIMLRNPVERIFSHYLANLRDGKTRLPFREEVDRDHAKTRKGWWVSHCYYETGLYYEQVRRYLDLFDPRQVMIIRYEDFRDDLHTVLEKLFLFLGVDHDFRPVVRTANEAMQPRSPRLNYLITKSGIKQVIFPLVPEHLRQRIKRAFFRSRVTRQLDPDERHRLEEFYAGDIDRLEKLTGLDLSCWKTAIHMSSLQDG